MALRIYTKDTVKTCTLLRKFLISNGTYVGFLRNLRNDFTMHLTQPFCSEYTPIPGILCGNFLENYVEHEITHGSAYDLISNAFPWASTDEGHKVWDRMDDKWCSFFEDFEKEYE